MKYLKNYLITITFFDVSPKHPFSQTLILIYTVRFQPFTYHWQALLKFRTLRWWIYLSKNHKIKQIDGGCSLKQWPNKRLIVLSLFYCYKRAYVTPMCDNARSTGQTKHELINDKQTSLGLTWISKGPHTGSCILHAEVCIST